MVATRVFKILNEFSFEVAGAVASSNILQESVGKVSGAADAALGRLSALGGFFTSGLGLQMSMLGVLSASVKSFENSQKSALAFANIVGSNSEFLVGNIDTFNDRLQFSEQILGRISKVAREFTLDEGTLLSTTKTLTAMLVPKGLAGENFETAIDMSRAFEKSAPILDVNTFESQGQLLRAIEGNAGMRDTLFRRLVAETQAFKELGPGGANSKVTGVKSGKGLGETSAIAQKFNLLPAAQRVDMLRRALGQFSSDADVASGMANLLSSRINRLRYQLVGATGALRPLGDAVTRFVGPLIDSISKWLDSKGEKMIRDMTNMFERMAGTPEQLYVNMKQLSMLDSDLMLAASTLSLLGIGKELLHLAKILKSGGISGAIAAVTAAIGSVLNKGAAAASGPLGALRIVFMSFAFVIRRIFLPIFLLTALFQLMSRAAAHARLQNAKLIAAEGGRISGSLDNIMWSLGRLTLPFRVLFDTIAQKIASLINMVTVFKLLILYTERLDGVISTIHMVIVSVIAGLHGAFTVAGEILGSIVLMTTTFLKNLYELFVGFAKNTLTAVTNVKDALMRGDFSGAAEAAKAPFLAGMPQLTSDPKIKTGAELSAMFYQAVDDVIAANVRALNDKDAEKNVVNRTTNIGKVEIRNEFREQQEPDRIASSLVQQLSEAARNPTQAYGRSLRGSLVR